MARTYDPARMVTFANYAAKLHPRIVRIDYVRDGTHYVHTGPWMGTLRTQSYLPGNRHTVKRAVVYA